MYYPVLKVFFILMPTMAQGLWGDVNYLTLWNGEGQSLVWGSVYYPNMSIFHAF